MCIKNKNYGIMDFHFTIKKMNLKKNNNKWEVKWK